ncbi:MAG: APC family permease, partial [Raineya sp.]
VGVKLIADVPAFLSVFLVSFLAYIGIKESKNASNFMVGVKILVILTVIAVGAFYINPSNWSPFAPNGVRGVLQGIAAIFFSYIGFDAVSTTAEECKNPQKDLPKAMILSVIISTALYVTVTLVLTGVMNYTQLKSDDPLADMFKFIQMDFLSGIVAASAIFAMTSVLLVFQLGQPRIWMTISRDGLLPKAFAKIHPKYQTPSYSTVVAGLIVALPTPFIDSNFVLDLTSIGTLFAFVLVCGGVLILQNSESGKRQIEAARFKVPYFNAKWIMPALLVFTLVLSLQFNSEGIKDFFTFSNQNYIVALEAKLQEQESQLAKATTEELKISVTKLKDEIQTEKQMNGFELFFQRLPIWFFVFVSLTMTWLSFKKN